MNFFYRLQFLFKKYSGRFSDFLRESITFFVSSSERDEKSWFTSFSYKSLFLIGIPVGLLIISSIHFYITKNERTKYLTNIQQGLEEVKNKISRMDQQAEAVNGYDDVYRASVNDIFEFLGNIKEENLWNDEGLGEVYPEDWKNYEKINGLNINQGIKTLNKNRLNQLVHLKHLNDIGEFNRLQQELRNHIPIGWPIANNRGYKTSDYGPRTSPFTKKKEFHAGVDLASTHNEYITATAAGRVYFSENRNNSGNLIMIKHKYGYRTIYAHNHKNLVKAGDIVKKGQRIATVGMTGRATGPHLHYEIRIGGQHVNPWDYVIGEF